METAANTCHLSLIVFRQRVPPGDVRVYSFLVMNCVGETAPNSLGACVEMSISSSCNTQVVVKFSEVILQGVGQT